MASAAGITIVVITGRECEATTRRLTELGVTDIYQNVKDKVAFLKQWIADNNLDKNEIAYIGDDINDLGAMKLCGYIGCPSDAAIEVKRAFELRQFYCRRPWSCERCNRALPQRTGHLGRTG